MLVVDQISKRLPNFSLSEITFKVSKGDYFILLGPSGSGKSLLLQILSGLVNPDSGKILLDGKDITRTPAGKRNIGILFQDLALFPHLNAYSNIAYPMKLNGLSSRNLKQKVYELAERFSIGHLLHERVTHLSGGEKQRVALARTVALNPTLLLLDEPLTAVDAQLHTEISMLLREINRSGTTVIHVTHAYEDAISLANRVGVITNGRIIQLGATLDVFQNPRSEFVAQFTGAKNFFKVQVNSYSAQGLSSGALVNGSQIAFYSINPCNLGFVFFPESSVVLSLQSDAQSAVNVFRGRVIDIFAQRFGYEVIIDCGLRVFALVTHESLVKLGIKPGIEIFATVKANAVRFIPAL